MNATDGPASESRIKCPGCGRDNIIPAAATRTGTVPGVLSCSRCRCELGPLVFIRQAADDSVRHARVALRGGSHALALDLAENAWNLSRHPQATCCGLLASVLLRDPVRIRTWLRRRKAGCA
jgi:hypothetical protein